MEELTLILTSILGFCLMFYGLVAYMRPYAKLKQIAKAKRVLLITAHPDDETMFFGPTIRHLNRQEGVSVFLLCLSTGDYRSQGRIRKGELYRACEALGIEEQNITICRYTKLRDDPKLRWREELVSDVIQHEVISNNFDVVITFDRGGVSGHKNHTSVFNALALLVMEKRLPVTTRIYFLRSVNLLRKYSFLLDLPMSFLLSPVAYIASLDDWWAIQTAMAKHSSQYVWFRKLYMAFSRYVLINTYDQMNNFREDKGR